MIFRPFKGEAVLAKISGCSPQGIQCMPALTFTYFHRPSNLEVVATDFFDHILVPSDELPDGATLQVTLPPHATYSPLTCPIVT